MKVILLRHGESIDDILNCYGGAADFDLSEAGFKTAIQVASYLEVEKIDKIYSSPLKRALHTAMKINDRQSCGIEIIKNLHERNSYGVLSGCNVEECKKIFGYILDSIEGKIGNYYSEQLILGAESLKEFDNRIIHAIGEVISDAEKNNYCTVAIVTHGNVTRSIYKNILKLEGKVDLELLSKTYIEVENGKFKLLKKEGVTIK